MESKHWYLSKTIWGAIIALLATILKAAGVPLPDDVQADMVDLALTLAGSCGAMLAIYGRVKAQTGIGGGDVPPKIGPTALLAGFLMVGLLTGGPVACASRAGESPAQIVYGIQADLNMGQRAALAVLQSGQIGEDAKDAIKRLDAAAVDAVKAAQDAVRRGDDPAMPAAIATARNAVDALLTYLKGE